MNDVNKKKAGWKQKLVYELVEYWINFVYLALFFAVFISYQRLILADYQISYEHYGIVVIKALILAKVIIIGDVLGLGRKLEDKPLIFPTVYKTVVFTLWVVLFNVVESTVRGLLHGKGLAGGLNELLSGHQYELLAHCLIIFFAFVPFFAFKELGRVLGEGKIRDMFFRRISATESDLSGAKRG
jgi:hypothetical protein